MGKTPISYVSSGFFSSEIYAHNAAIVIVNRILMEYDNALMNLHMQTRGFFLIFPTDSDQSQ